MSREQTPNTPRAHTTITTAEHTPTPTPGQQQQQQQQAAPAPVPLGRLSPSPSPSNSNSDFPPRRSTSLRPSSPKANDTSTSVRQVEDDGGGGGGGGEGQDRDDDDDDDDGRRQRHVNGKNEMEDAKEQIEGFDWEALEARFWERMEECRRVEEGVREEFRDLVEVFNAWAIAGSVGEEDRAAKRLRTRMAFVQQKEESLEVKRLHYIKVVQAFESALALLSGP